MLNRFLRAGRKRLARSPLFPAATGANKGPGRGMPPGEKRGLRLTGRVLRAAGVPSGAAPDNTPWDFEVRIATPGYSREGRWFLSREVLREAAPLFEGAQAFAKSRRGRRARHPRPRRLAPERADGRIGPPQHLRRGPVGRLVPGPGPGRPRARDRGALRFFFRCGGPDRVPGGGGGPRSAFSKNRCGQFGGRGPQGPAGGRPPGPRRGRSAGYRGGGDGEIVQKTQGGRTGGRRQTRREMDAAAADLGLRESGPRFGSRAERRRHGKRKSPSDAK